MSKVELVKINKKYKGDNFENALFATANAINHPLSSKKESKGFENGSQEYWSDNSNKSGDFAIKNLNLTIPEDKVTVLLGPSGSGKSTILKMIAGLEEFDSGEIRYDGQEVSDVPPRDRELGIVFEDFALYPHQDSKSNILARLIFDKDNKDDQVLEERLEETSKLLGVDIEYLLNKKPGNLSYGEQQRVALGRCITRDPKLFLLDEPFASLDAKLRDRYRVELKRLLDKFEITTIYVTHNQKEAIALADEIVIIRDGRIEQVDNYQDLYNKPKNIFVAEFLNLDTETKAINLIESSLIPIVNDKVIVGVRPEDMIIIADNDNNSLQGKVTNVELRPTRKVKVIEIDYKGKNIVLKVDIETELSVGQTISFKFDKYHLFAAETGERIKTIN